LVTDEIGSGPLYALAVGMKIQYVPNTLSFEFAKNVVSATVKSESTFFSKSPQLWVDNFAPNINYTRNAPKQFIELAWEELGEKSLLSLNSLAKLNWKKNEGLHKYFEEYKKIILDFDVRKYY
jgi:hypothetical protein